MVFFSHCFFFSTQYSGKRKIQRNLKLNVFFFGVSFRNKTSQFLHTNGTTKSLKAFFLHKLSVKQKEFSPIYLCSFTKQMYTFVISIERKKSLIKPLNRSFLFSQWHFLPWNLFSFFNFFLKIFFHFFFVYNILSINHFSSFLPLFVCINS